MTCLAFGFCQQLQPQFQFQKPNAFILGLCAGGESSSLFLAASHFPRFPRLDIKAKHLYGSCSCVREFECRAPYDFRFRFRFNTQFLAPCERRIFGRRFPLSVYCFRGH